MCKGTDLTVPQEVELVDAVVHALHVLEDVWPRVWRGTQGGHVARLQTHTRCHRTRHLHGPHGRPACNATGRIPWTTSLAGSVAAGKVENSRMR